MWKYNPSSNQWTWISGSSSFNKNGTYGTRGVPSSANTPGGRQNSISWIDSNGNLWLFGGNGFAETGGIAYLNDLWKYDVTNNTWTWVSGSKTSNQAAVYGTQGTESGSNIPSARFGALSWIQNDNLYLFGGQIAASTRVNDLWKFNIASQKWTWISGNNTSNQNGIYGTKGVSSVQNIPGARQAGIAWTGNDNKFYLFGGDGAPYAGPASYLNDLWSFNPSNNEWTWISGSDTTFDASNYGTKGVASNTNIPGARQMSITFKDSDGNLCLFGGWGSAGINFGRLNDLWKFNLNTNQWTWVAGANTADQTGTYGSLGSSNTSNFPGARRMSVSWSDANGNFWLFGGNMTDGASGSLLLNDLWKISNTTITSNTDISPSDEFMIYPNPTQNSLTVECKTLLNGTFTLTNIHGAVILTGKIINKQVLDLTPFSNGIYFLTVGNVTHQIIKN